MRKSKGKGEREGDGKEGGERSTGRGGRGREMEEGGWLQEGETFSMIDAPANTPSPQTTILQRLQNATTTTTVRPYHIIT